MSALRGGLAVTQRRVEGPGAGSDWARWQRDGRLPSVVPNDFAHAYVEHFARLVENGFAACRFTLDWATIVPSTNRPDRDALEHVEAIVDAARAAGLEMWLGLHDAALPGWFVDEGAFVDDKARGRYWPAYVDLVAQTVGDRVTGWFPVIEPFGTARRGYLTGERPPGRADAETHAKAVRGIWLAWRDAWRLLRGGPPVATALDLAPVYRADNTLPTQQAAHELDEGTFGVTFHALRDGLLRVPGLAEAEVEDLRDSCDVIGLVYRGAVTVDGEGTTAPYPADARQPWIEGLTLALRRVADELPGRHYAIAALPITGDAARRGEVVDSARATLEEARADGIDVSLLVLDVGVDYADCVWPEPGA